MSTLGKKQRIKNESWLETLANIETLMPEAEVKKLAAATIKEIKATIKGKKAAYGWSGGKDSIVLDKLCEAAGINNSLLGICNLEYPAFMKWLEENKPENCEIVNTGQDLEWLLKRLNLLFPQDAKTAAPWFNGVQLAAQARYCKNQKLDILVLGRRLADGNFVGKGTNIYTNNDGITRYNPISDWKHEHILAYIHYNQLPLPPIYAWVNGYLCGTHPWPARQWTGSIENGWSEVYSIDPEIVKSVADRIESARLFLEGVAG